MVFVEDGRVGPEFHRVALIAACVRPVDLLVAFYQGLIGVRIGPGSLGAAYFIPTVVVPPLLVSHGLMFWAAAAKAELGAKLTGHHDYAK